MKPLLFCLLLAATLPSLAATPQGPTATWLALDFEDRSFFTPEQSAERGRIGDSTWRNLKAPGGSIVAFDDGHGQALQIERATGGYAAMLCGVKPLPEGVDFTAAMDLNLGQGGSIYVTLYGAKPLGGVMPTGGGMLKVQHNGVWKLTDILLPTSWFRLEMAFRPAHGTYDVRVTLPDGTVHTAAGNGMANLEPLKVIQAGNIPPVGNKGTIDNLLVTYSRISSTSGREDVSKSKDAVYTATVKDQPVTLPYTFTEDASVAISVDLKQLADISTIVFIGNDGFRGRAAGINAGGQRVQLATPVKFVATGNGIQADFDHSIYDRLKISVDGTAGMVLEDFASTAIRGWPAICWTGTSPKSWRETSNCPSTRVTARRSCTSSTAPTRPSRR